MLNSLDKPRRTPEISLHKIETLVGKIIIRILTDIIDKKGIRSICTLFPSKGPKLSWGSNPQTATVVDQAKQLVQKDEHWPVVSRMIGKQ